MNTFRVFKITRTIVSGLAHIVMYVSNNYSKNLVVGGNENVRIASNVAAFDSPIYL